jgi:excisionase family DNA binding protein
MAKKEQIERRFFTTSEVARFCEVSNDGVLNWIKSGKLRAFATPGGHYRVSAEDFRTFLARYDIPFEESLFGAPSEPRCVLVVDDDPDIREIVRRRLLELDAALRIEEASDGYDAGIQIGSLQPDLVIVDIMMPRVDGFSLCRSMRANPRTREIKVLAITAFPEQDNIRRMYEAGADLCLVKPLDFGELERAVRHLLGPDRRSQAPSRKSL